VLLPSNFTSLYLTLLKTIERDWDALYFHIWKEILAVLKTKSMIFQTIVTG
jgi:hypothetical protein